MINLENKKIYFIGAHPDDIELGCGGLISTIQNKDNVYCVTLSHNPKFKGHPNKHKLLESQMKSLTFLGIPKKNITICNFPTLDFPNVRREICDYLFHKIKTQNPDIVFTHSIDTNYDHNIVLESVSAIFKGITLINFVVLNSNHNFRPNLFFELTEKDVLNKLKALSYYDVYKDKYYFNKDFIKNDLIRKGVFIRKKYAEGFEIKCMGVLK